MVLVDKIFEGLEEGAPLLAALGGASRWQRPLFSETCQNNLTFYFKYVSKVIYSVVVPPVRFPLPIFSP
jgi:hypothetical protein